MRNLFNKLSWSWSWVWVFVIGLFAIILFASGNYLLGAIYASLLGGAKTIREYEARGRELHQQHVELLKEIRVFREADMESLRKIAEHSYEASPDQIRQEILKIARGEREEPTHEPTNE